MKGTSRGPLCLLQGDLQAPEMGTALEQLESNYENRVPHHEKHTRDELRCRKNSAAGAQGEQVFLGIASWLKMVCEASGPMVLWAEIPDPE